MIQTWYRTTGPCAAGASLATVGYQARSSRRSDESHIPSVRGMADMGNESEALVLRIVMNAELKRLKGSRAKRAWGSGSAGFDGWPTHMWYPPVYRDSLTRSMGAICETC